MSDSLNNDTPTGLRMGMGGAPPAVQAAADRADQLIREMAARTNAPQTPANQPAEAPQGEASARTEAAPAVPANAGGEGMQPTPAPLVQAPPPAEAAAPDVAMLREQITRLEQEMKTWRGRYEAELPRERDLRLKAEQELEALTTRLAAAESAAPEAPAYAPLSEDEVNQYGADLFALAERYLMPKIDARLKALLAPLSARFDGLESRLGVTTAKVAKTETDLFYDRLTERMPDWRDIDNDPAFATWLEEHDPLFGEPRKNALANRAKARDDAGTIRVFEAFLNQRDASGSQKAVEAPPVAASGTGAMPTAPTQAPAPSLADFAAPGRPSAAPNPAASGVPSAKTIWSTAEIAAFYTDLRKGVYRDREAEADRIERDIALAQREGRVRQ